MLALTFTHLLNIASWITVSVPCALYRLLTWPFTLQCNLLGLLLVCILVLTAVYLVIHEEYLAQYSSLEAADATKPSSATFDIHSTSSTITTTADHPDVYLEALLLSTKLFRSLEQPAFREMSRYVQIKNVPKGDLLFNDNNSAEKESLYIVVKGAVDVYIKSNNNVLSHWEAEDRLEEKLKHCRLIRQAGPGDNISSLLTVLTSFQECHDRNLAKLQRQQTQIQQHLQKQNQQRPFQKGKSCSEPSLSSRRDSDVYNSLDDKSRSASPSSSSSCSSDLWSPVFLSFDRNAIKGMAANANAISYQEPLTITDDDRRYISTNQQYTITTSYNKNSNQRSSSSSIYTKHTQKSAQPSVIAHAATDTVLAVIPKKAFFSIYRHFPTSASSIAKFVLTRFQRVSMMTSRQYFGLTDQILDMEHRLNCLAKSDDDTSNHCFKNKNTLQRLRNKYWTKQHNATQTQQSVTVNIAAMGNQESDTQDLQERRPDRHRPMSFTSHAAQSTEDGLIRKSIAKCFVHCLGLITLPNTNEDINSTSSSSSEASFSRCGLPDNHEMAPRAQLIDYVKSQVQIMSFKKGSTLIQEGCKSNGIYFVIDGSLKALVEKDKQDTLENSSMDDKRCSDLPGYLKDVACKRKRLVFDINPCQTAGYFSALTDGPSLFQVCAKTDCLVGYLSKECLHDVSVEYPLVMVELARRAISVASPLLLHIDLALDCTQVSAGQVIYRKDDLMDSSFIMLHGRLQLIQQKENSGPEIIKEFAKGDDIGELEITTTTPLPWTLRAVRDSEMARIPKTLLGALLLQYPQISLKVSQRAARRSLQQTTSPEIARAYTQHLREKITELSISYSATHQHVLPELYKSKNKPMYTVGIIPVNSTVPIMAFAEHLKLALTDSVGAKCTLVNSAIATAAMGDHVSCQYEQLQLATWLAELEQDGRTVLYVADSGERSLWTKTCLRQADCILLVGEALGDSSVGGHEKMLIDVKTTARQELVLLHSERLCASGVTRSWLKDRMWIQAHHHVMMPANKLSQQKSNGRLTSEHAILSSFSNSSKATSKPIYLYNQIKDRIPLLWNLFSSMMCCNYSQMKPIYSSQSINADSSCHHSTASQTEIDFARLGRRLCGTSVALALGGSADGIEYIEFIQALEKVGIPIDMISGTSIGSLVGGCYAQKTNLSATVAQIKAYEKRVGTWCKQVLDLIPVMARCKEGHSLDRAICKCIGDRHFEDFWLPFFTANTNNTYSRMEIHTSGNAWRRIRKSLSLSGQASPLVDHGNMHMDGSFVNNIPASVARDMGAGIIIAANIASAQPNTTHKNHQQPIRHCNDSLSKWHALFYSHLVLFRLFNIPNMDQIQQRLASVLGVTRSQEAKTTDGALYTKPPVPAVVSPCSGSNRFD